MKPPDPKKKPYPEVMYRWDPPPVEVSPAEFVDQWEAAEVLKVSLFSVGRLIGESRLDPVTLDGVAGVSRSSLEKEIAYRKRSPIRARLRSFFHWF